MCIKDQTTIVDAGQFGQCPAKGLLKILSMQHHSIVRLQVDRDGCTQIDGDGNCILWKQRKSFVNLIVSRDRLTRTFPKTTACSPCRIVLPGALEIIRVVAIFWLV